MAIVEDMIEIALTQRVSTHYEKLGYNIPRVKSKTKNKMIVPNGTRISVKVNDLPKGSNIKFVRTCDCCGDKCKPLKYARILEIRVKNNGADYCLSCANKMLNQKLSVRVPVEKTIAYVYPHLVQDFWLERNVGLTCENVYINSNKILWWKCPVNSEHNYQMQVACRTKGSGCPYCAGRKVNHTNCLATTHPELLIEWHPSKNIKSPFEIISGSHFKIWWLCSSCCHEWIATPKDRSTNYKTGCPKCSESQGEKRVRKFLEENNIPFKPQFTFPDLVGIGGGLLRFDFGLLNANEEPICLIEYDGIFHFEKQYDDDGFETIQIHDQFKNKYCTEKSIPFLRIKYTEFDQIEEILNNKLHTIIRKLTT